MKVENFNELKRFNEEVDNIVINHKVDCETSIFLTTYKSEGFEDYYTAVFVSSDVDEFGFEYKMEKSSKLFETIIGLANFTTAEKYRHKDVKLSLEVISNIYEKTEENSEKISKALKISLGDVLFHD